MLFNRDMNTVIQKRSLADEVAAGLQQQISAGAYKVGDKLPTEPNLMKAFGVGRSSIREAIKILVNSGLLSVQQGVGTFVENQIADREPLGTRLKRADYGELDEVRKLLEIKIAQKAAQNCVDSDIQKMKGFLDARKKAATTGDLPGSIAADIQFHVALAEASGNEILLDLYKAVAAHMESWFMKVNLDTSSFIQTQHMHEELLKHIRKGQSEAAWNMAIAIIDHG